MCEIPIFDHSKITTIYLTSLHKHVLTFFFFFKQFLSEPQTCIIYWVVGPKIDPLLLDHISQMIHQQPTARWPQVWLLSWSGERKPCCSSSHQCGLLVITTRLSLQQTAHSLDFHLRDNTINQIRTSSSCSHISFHSSGTRAVILFLKSQSDKPHLA